MDHLHITFDKLDVGAINDLVKHKSCGAISLFVGTTRDNFENKEVITLEYEAYKPMAIKQLQLICKELRAKWTELAHIAIYHRLGCVPVSEESVVIAISSPHREASLQAVAHAIEELKKRVPIWKKEQYKNSESTWKENKESHGLKAKKARFDASMLSKIETDDVSSDLVQITVDDEEIKRRMDCFVKQKRREIDINNIIDYTNPTRQLPGIDADSESDNVSTCARTDSVIVKQENSNCHLRVRVVRNKTGPQERSSSYKKTLSKLMEQNIKAIKKEPGIETETEDLQPNHIRTDIQKQRLKILETYLGLSVHQEKSIYERLKAVEDKVLKLETLSPEYKHFLQNESSTMCSRCHSSQLYETNSTISIQDYHQHNFHTSEDLDAIIERMEKEQEEFDKATCGTSSNASTHEDDFL